MKRLRIFWLSVRLRWRGICPKHYTRRESACMPGGHCVSYCAECEREEQLRYNARTEFLIAELKKERGA